MSEDADSGRDIIGPQAQRPKEWWIDERPEVNWDAAFRKNWGSSKYINVIEFSAYAQACKERDELKALLAQANEHVVPGMADTADSIIKIISERNHLRVELASLRNDNDYAMKDLALVIEERDTLKETIVSNKAEIEKNSFQLSEARAEIERLKENQLGSFDVAVPSDEWYDTEKLLAECETALERIEATIDNGIWIKSDLCFIARETLAKLKQMRGGDNE